MKASELRNKTVSELQSELIASLREIFNLRMQRGVGQSGPTHLFRKAKKFIARIKTVIREKEGSIS